MTNFYDGQSAIMGFYVEGVANDGSLGPDETIHPKFDGTHSASSYNFTLKKLYYLMYKISTSFKDIVIEHFKDVYNVELKFNPNYKSNDKLERELFEKMLKLPNAYFPSEFRQTSYEFKLENKKFYILERPINSIELNGMFTTIESGDGFSRSWRMPFMQKR